MKELDKHIDEVKKKLYNKFDAFSWEHGTEYEGKINAYYFDVEEFLSTQIQEAWEKGRESAGNAFLTNPNDPL